MGRTLFFLVTAFFWTLFCLLLSAIAALFPGGRIAMDFIGRSVWAPVWLRLGKTRVESWQHPAILDDRSYVFVSNHQGYFDIAATMRSTQHILRFMAKVELFYIPPLGFYLWRTGSPAVARGHTERAKRTFRKAARRVADGTSLLVYAEGTRTRDGSVLPFKRGAFVLAIEAQVPIVPVTVTGSFAVFNRNSWRITPGLIKVHIGEPIATTGMTYDDRGELSKRVHGAILERYREMDGTNAKSG